MMVVILTPVDGIIRWLPRGFSCSPIINIRDAADTNVQTGQNNLQSAKSVAQLTSALSELAKQFWEKRG